jgi:hypothetical protein
MLVISLFVYIENLEVEGTCSSCWKLKVFVIIFGG